MSEPIPSPCVRNCCLTDDDICVGCYRSITEICAWTKLSDKDKRRVLELAQERRQRMARPAF